MFQHVTLHTAGEFAFLLGSYMRCRPSTTSYNTQLPHTVAMPDGRATLEPPMCSQQQLAACQHVCGRAEALHDLLGQQPCAHSLVTGSKLFGG